MKPDPRQALPLETPFPLDLTLEYLQITTMKGRVRCLKVTSKEDLILHWRVNYQALEDLALTLGPATRGLRDP